LALAQAALETGWGSSHAAMAKNSPFGHMAGSKVKAFDDLYQAVHAYIHNLNTNNAYKPLHMARAEIRQKNEKPTGHHLAKGLKKYSIQGDEYISKVRTTIDRHGLKEFDKAELSKS
jgi:Bax protein